MEEGSVMCAAGQDTRPARYGRDGDGLRIGDGAETDS